jgi:hypothetical protein
LLTAEEYYNRLQDLAERNAHADLANIGKRQAAEVAIFTDKSPAFSQEQKDAARLRFFQLVAQADAEHLKLAKSDIDLTNQRVLSAKRLAEEFASIAAQVAEARGDTVGAALLNFDNTHREQLERLQAIVAHGGTEASARASDAIADNQFLRQQVSLRTALSDSLGDYQRTLDEVAVSQGRIDLLQQTGAVTELDALNKRADLARAYLPILQREVDAYERLAKTLPEGSAAQADAIVKVQQYRLEIDKLAASTGELANRFRGDLSSSTSDFLTAIATGSKSAKDAFNDLVRSLDEKISRRAADSVSDFLFSKNGPFGGASDFLAQMFGGGKASDVTGAATLTTAGTTLTGAGTLLTTAATTLQSAAATLAASSATSGGGGIFGSLFGPNAIDVGDNFAGGVPFFASGTDFAPGGLAVVGERGRELVKLPRGSQVFPNARTEKMLAGGGHTFNNSFHITVPPGTPSATANQIAVQAARKMQRSMALYG